ncbi:MAG: carbohydrate porin [Candidatus Rifleibacteriota bacterium]
MYKKTVRHVLITAVFLTFFLQLFITVPAYCTEDHDRLQNILERLVNRKSAREKEAARLGLVLPSQRNGSRCNVSKTEDCSDTSIKHPQRLIQETEKKNLEISENLALSEAVETVEPAEEAERKPRLMPIPFGFDAWQKERIQSADKGWEYEFNYTGEYIKVQDNYDGKRKSVYLDNLSLSLNVDFEKAGLARNGSFFVSLLGNSGGNITGEHLDNSGIGRIGDLQVLSNIETNESFRLYELFFEKPFGKGRLLVGLRDMNADFYASEFSSFFTNSSFGIGPDVAQNAPVSIFNVTAPTIRLSYDLNENLTLQGAIIDGQPGSADDNRNGFGLRISPDEGFFGILEAQYRHKLFSKDLDGSLKIGTWKHTGKFDDVINTDASGEAISRDGNWGTYMLIDQKLWVRKSNPDSHIGGFIQIGGLTPTDRSGIEKYFGGGIVFNAPFANRPNDAFGIAVNQAETNSRVRDFNIASGNIGLTKERVFEVDYSCQVNDWLSIKPYIQVIKNVSADPTRDRTQVFGLRFNSTF